MRGDHPRCYERWHLGVRKTPSPKEPSSKTHFFATAFVLALAATGCAAGPAPEETESTTAQALANESGDTHDYKCTASGYCECEGLAECNGMFRVCKQYTYCYQVNGVLSCCSWNFSTSAAATRAEHAATSTTLTHAD